MSEEPAVDASRGSNESDPAIAVVITVTPDYGGVYQYTRTVIQALQSSEIDARYYHTKAGWSDTDLYDETWRRIPLAEQAVRFGVGRLFERTGADPTRLGRLRGLLSPTLLRFDPDLTIYPSPNPMAFELPYPYLMAVHDLQHRINPQFPEVSADGEWKHREYLFRHGSENAAGILADSPLGKEDVLKYYDVEADRVHVLPHLPPDYLDDGEIDEELRKELPNGYLFYPAQYWEHKNHVRLLEAVAILRDEHDLETPLVLVGGQKNAYEDVQDAIDRLDLDGLVHQLGYVDDDKIYTLYTGARALVMPTFFGPTNIPILEAFALGCPVITSNVHGLPDQVGDAGLLIDPESPEDIAESIQRIWTDPELRETLADRGRDRIESYTREDFRDRLIDAVRASLEVVGD